MISTSRRNAGDDGCPGSSTGQGATTTADVHEDTSVHTATESFTPVPSSALPNTKPQHRPRIHMHPAKRRLLLVLALGSVLGGVLMLATLRFVVTPLQRWNGSAHHDSLIELERLRTDVSQLHSATTGSSERMKLLLHQIQRSRVASSTRTGLVEKAAAQSYREHARDHLREQFMAIKEGILLQTSQRRRIEDAREELQKMTLTADALLLQLGSEMDVSGQLPGGHGGGFAVAVANHTSASSSLANSIRSIRLAMLDDSLDALNETSEELQPYHSEATTLNDSLSSLPGKPTTHRHNHDQDQDHDHDHGVVVYLVVFGVVGVWLWSVVTDERTRKTSMVFHTHRAIWRALGSVVVVERVGPSSTKRSNNDGKDDDDDYNDNDEF